MFLCLIGASYVAIAQTTGPVTIDVTDTTTRIPLGPSLEFLEDATGRLTFEDISNPDAAHAWKRIDREVPNFGTTDSAIWMHVRLHNAASGQTRWYLDYADPMFQYLQVYVTDASGTVRTWRAGSMEKNASPERVMARTHVFPLDLETGASIDVYVRGQTPYSLLVPVYLWHPTTFAATKQTESIAHGVYIGIIVALALYNLSVFVYLRESVYLLYVVFMLLLATNNLCLNGLMGQHVLSGHQGLLNAVFALSFNTYMVAAVYFSKIFLGRRAIFSVFVKSIATGNLIVTLLWFRGAIVEWTIMTVILGFVVSVSLLLFGVQRWRRGDPSAGFYTIGFGSVLSGTLIFTCMLFGLLPTNAFTYNATEIGSAFEAILLSTALSRRIKQMRDQEKCSAIALAAAQSDKIAMVERHNQTLDEQVKTRTAELIATQQKLITSEKMAALGVFTAGMAHEINNPANFVSVGAQNTAAHIGELRNFVHDLLSDDPDPEITEAFNSRFKKLEKSNATVTEGITRIERVVKQLRADHPEGDTGMQPADVVSSLDSAWRVLSSALKTPVDLHTHFGARPQASCMIAEINQVFLALLGNAVHAIEDAVALKGEDFRGQITLTSDVSGSALVITVMDNGIGIPDDHLDKVFDPFFTTKTVGRGAGLGLSMARDVVAKHGGMLTVASVEGQGATFTLTLPLAQG